MLRKGETFRPDRDGLAVVEALREATITISEAPARRVMCKS